jgi:hypothetical protein
MQSFSKWIFKNERRGEAAIGPVRGGPIRGLLVTEADEQAHPDLFVEMKEVGIILLGIQFEWRVRWDSSYCS